jgi:hypothetical protein
VNDFSGPDSRSVNWGRNGHDVFRTGKPDLRFPPAPVGLAVNLLSRSPVIGGRLTGRT